MTKPTDSTTKFYFKKSFGYLIFSLFILSQDVHAFKLGQPVVKSKIDEPLLAEINITEISQSEGVGFQIKLADKSTYDLAKIDFPKINGLPLELQADLLFKDDVKPYIRVVSKVPVNLNLINLLFDFRWATGRLMNNVPLYLDNTKLVTINPISQSNAQIKQSTPELIIQSTTSTSLPNRASIGAPKIPALPDSSNAPVSPVASSVLRPLVMPQVAVSSNAVSKMASSSASPLPMMKSRLNDRSAPIAPASSDSTPTPIGQANQQTRDTANKQQNFSASPLSSNISNAWQNKNYRDFPWIEGAISVRENDEFAFGTGNLMVGRLFATMKLNSASNVMNQSDVPAEKSISDLKKSNAALQARHGIASLKNQQVDSTALNSVGQSNITSFQCVRSSCLDIARDVLFKDAKAKGWSLIFTRRIALHQTHQFKRDQRMVTIELDLSPDNALLLEYSFTPTR